jgi:hypothetical protein
MLVTKGRIVLGELRRGHMKLVQLNIRPQIDANDKRSYCIGGTVKRSYEISATNYTTSDLC